MNAEVILYMLDKMPTRLEVQRTCWCGRSMCRGNRSATATHNLPKPTLTMPWWWPFGPAERG